MQRVSCELGNKTVSIEVGKIAKQAGGAAWVQCGGSVVLVTAVAEKNSREGDFLPLMVEYREKGYATGRIPGGFFKRESRPGTEETLICRLIDRPLRPRFPKGYSCETQILATVLSADKVNSTDILSFIGASASLHVSDIPFDGPIAGVRVGLIDGKFVINPSSEELENSEIDLVVAGSRDAVLMVEGGARIVSEAVLLDAIFFGHKAMKPLLDMQDELRRLIGKPKREIKPKVQVHGLRDKVQKMVGDRLNEAMFLPGKMEKRQARDEIEAVIVNALEEEYPDLTFMEITEHYDRMEKEIVRKAISKNQKRIDGRGLTDIRPISCEYGLLPQVHGTALFTRGETQALATVTLGTREDEQKIEAIAGDWWKTFILHYNFPPYSVNEVKMRLGPGRREIGHGALAERAIEKVIPPHEDFPYTIRLVSEIMESNGSSSMATVCAGSLALMDAGVPVKAQVAGIAMGLIKEGDEFFVISDILGAEDHYGDMDFKVAGTRDGVTAFQMDIKIGGVTRQIMEKALNQARDGRLHILDKMDEVLSKPKSVLSKLAPRITKIKIPVNRIKDLIGPGGKMIKSIVEQTGASINVEDDGTVHIASVNGEANEMAVRMVEDLTTEVEVGKFYKGTVRKVMDFGAFVEVIPGTDGLVHISQLDHYRVGKVTDVLHEGDTTMVKCIGIDGGGKISLSRKEALGRDLEGNIVDPVAAFPKEREDGGKDDGGDRSGPDQDNRRRGRRDFEPRR